MNPWISTIGIKSGGLPSCETIFHGMKEVPGYAPLDFEWITDEEDRYVFRTPQATLAVSLLKTDENPDSAVLTTDELISACKRAWHWPEAGMQMLKMNRQIAVAIRPELSEEKGLDPLDVALLMNCLILSLLKNTEAVGVYWNHSGKIIMPEDFISRSEGMNRKMLPVDLWVDFRMVPHPEEKTISFGTFGMERFSLMEMEVSHSQRDPRWVMNWMFNLAHSLIENGMILQEKQTFGLSEDEKFFVTHEKPLPEMERGYVADVLQLHFDEPVPE
ncbi:MAG: DUF4261 domain-containing protein [Planctomycetia bacterium]|nr:DUF4261 domain-containing protein [Planctomycetia bacterium]